MHKSQCKHWRRPLSVFAFCILNFALPVTADSAAAQTPTGPVLVSHEFVESAEGWQVAGDTGTVAPRFTGADGGYISGSDEAIGETWYFRAPASVLRHLPGAVNGTISFRLRQSGSEVSLFDDDVVIVAPAGRLSYRFPAAPGTEWTDFSVRLVEGEGWTWNWNRRATQAQIDSVLAAATGLDIRGEYVTGADEGSLDKFQVRGPAR
jgi:hypothetical protein